MKKYQYQIVRYIHDRVTSEFVNVGVIVYQKETNFFDSKFVSKYSRISKFFNSSTGANLIATLKNFEIQIQRISKQLTEIFQQEFNDISDITNIILPKDDSALECTITMQGLDVNPESALDGLFDRLVNKYIPETEKEARSDNEVWKTHYKKFFDKYNITKKLVSHEIKTKNDKIEFDKSWKNGSWHCYQALSFDLKRTESIKNKVYKWSGIINELENTNELIHLYLLMEDSKKHKEINNFILDTFKNRDNENLKVSIVNQKEAEKFAKHVLYEIEDLQSDV